MAIYKNIRHNPFICFLITIGSVLRGRIHFSKEYIGKTLRMDDGQQFTIFRHMTLEESASNSEATPTVFIVRFKFATLSQQANRVLLLIVEPFSSKCYAHYLFAEIRTFKKEISV